MLSESSARSCHEALLRSRHDDLRRDLYETAVRYARARAEWKLAEPEARAALDPDRTRAHDAFIDACNILCRAMGRSGEPTAWRDLLTDDRKVIGDFACFLHLYLSLQAR